MQPITLEPWEYNLVLHLLAKLPYEESAAVIQLIKDKVE
jgi:hypothetical protein